MEDRGGVYDRVFLDSEDKKAYQVGKLDYVKSRCDNWWTRTKTDFDRRTATYDALDWASVFLPCISWLRKYDIKTCLLADIIAGLSIGAMVIPQGMSYAVLAGLPPQYGLYGAFVPVLIYAVFGSSPQLAVGPVAITSLLLSDGLRDIIDGSKDIDDPAKPGDLADVQQQYNEAAIQVAFLVACFYTGVGVLRLGFMSRFLSHSVISGFTTGAAVLIGSTQIKYFFGVKVPNTNNLIDSLHELHKAVDKYGTNWREAVMFSFWLAFLIALKQISKRVTKLRWIRAIGPMTVCIIAIICVKAVDNLRDKIKIIKSIPSGLPKQSIDQWGPLLRGETDVRGQVVLAIIVMLVDFTESISIASALARRGKYRIHITQEIVGLGIANFFGAMFHCYTTTGSFSRSAISFDLGSKTGLFGVFTALLVMLVLLVLTPVFELLPYNTLGAIVVSAVMGLFDIEQAFFLWNASFLDFIVWLAAAIGVILGGVEIGIAIAVGLALLFVIYQSAFPHTAVLGRLPGTSVYRSTEQYPHAQRQNGIVVVRIDAPLYFANIVTVQERIADYLEEARAVQGPIKFVVLDLGPVPFVDSTGMHVLLDLTRTLNDEGIRLVLANPCSKVKAHLGRVHLLDAIGREWVFVRTSDAVDACVMSLSQGDKSDPDDDKQPVSEAVEVERGTAASMSPPRSAQSATLPIHWPEIANRDA